MTKKAALMVGVLVLSGHGCVRAGFNPQDGQAKPDGLLDAISSDSGLDDSKLDQQPGDGGVLPGTYLSIAVGTFQMGSPTSETCRSTNERQHPVTLTRAFLLQRTEITQSQFQQLMGYNPSFFQACGGSCPVEDLTWHEAVAYCNALSASESLPKCFTCTGSQSSVTCTVKSSYTGASYTSCTGYRLPTEAEWEYAYRASTTTAYHSGANDPQECMGRDAVLDTIAWYLANSAVTYSGCDGTGGRCIGPHPVGGRTPNAWGLHDMAGNVWEWVYDRYVEDYPTTSATDPAGPSSGTERVLRGGSWVSNPRYTRAACRFHDPPTFRNKALGFRCARTP